MKKQFLFAELKTLPRESSGCVSEQALRALNLPVPDDVLEQVLCDHGANPEFQIQYARLDLRATEWHLEHRRASELCGASVYSRFSHWVESVEHRTRTIRAGSWREFDVRDAVVAHWRTNGTWQRAPVFLDHGPLGQPTGIHLIEGHTRLGALRGLVGLGMVRTDSEHVVWVGGAASNQNGVSALSSAAERVR